MVESTIECDNSVNYKSQSGNTLTRLTRGEMRTLGIDGDLCEIIHTIAIENRSELLPCLFSKIGNVLEHVDTMQGVTDGQRQVWCMLRKIREELLSIENFYNGKYTGSHNLVLSAQHSLSDQLSEDIRRLHDALPTLISHIVQRKVAKTLEQVIPEYVRNASRKTWKTVAMTAIAGVVFLPMGNRSTTFPEEKDHKPTTTQQTEEMSTEELDTEKRATQPEDTQKKQGKPGIEIGILQHHANEIDFLGSKHTPDINAADLRRAGEEQRKKNIEALVIVPPLAELINPSDEIDNCLWQTSIFGHGTNSTLRRVEQHVHMLDEKNHGTVILGPEHGIQAKKNTAIVLPRPVGFAATNVTVEPKCRFLFNSRSQTIEFHEDQTAVTVRYEIRKISDSTHTFPEGNLWFRHKKRVTSDLDASVIEKLQKAKNEAEQRLILTNYLAHYTYITSSQLQMLLDALPGTPEEKLSFIRYGDCDTLSAHIAHIQTRSGKRGSVHIGFVEQGNAIHTSPKHAVARVGGDEGTQFETTNKTDEVYEGVVFEEKDWQVLLKLVKDAPAEPTDEERVALYEEFNNKLTTILHKPEYYQFSKKTNLQRTSEQMGRALRNTWEWLRKGTMDMFRSENPYERKSIVMQFIDIILAMGTIIFALIAGIVGIAVCINILENLKRNLYTKPLSKIRENAHRRDMQASCTLFNSIKQEEDMGEYPMRKDALKTLYRNHEHLERVLPYEDALGLSTAEQEMLMQLMTVWPHVAKEKGDYLFATLFGSIHVAWSQYRLQREIQKLLSEKEKPTLQEVAKRAQSIKTNPREMQEKREQIPTKARSILLASREDVEIVNRLDLPVHTVPNGGHQSLIARTLGNGMQSRAYRHGYQGGDRDDVQPYVPGTDYRYYDDKRSARYGKDMVRLRAPERNVQDHRAVHVIVDAMHIGKRDEDLRKIGTLLLSIQQGKSNVHIASLEICAHGTTLIKYTERTMQSLLRDKTGRSIQVLLEKILSANLENRISEDRYGHYRYWHWRGEADLEWRYPSGARERALKYHKHQVDCLVMGAPKRVFASIHSPHVYWLMGRDKHQQCSTQFVTSDSDCITEMYS